MTTTTQSAQTTSTSRDSQSTNTVSISSVGSASTSIQSPTTTASSAGSAPTTQSLPSQTSSANSASSSPVTSNSVSATNSGTDSASSTAGSMTMAQSNATMMASGWTGSSNSTTSGSGSSNTMMPTSQPSTSIGGTTGMNSSMGMINCPSFACNYSDCYSMYMSQNTTSCTPGYCCELIRQTDMYYTVGCSASCSYSCFNSSQTNCTVSCCNSTGCLNGTFASMMMTTTPAMTTTKKATPMVTTTARPQTTANKGNKCSQGKCTGTDCYKTFKNLQMCSSSEPHCQLKKETVGTSLQWTAGCTTNCSAQTPCKTSTTPPCHLECCTATMTSCLMMNGTLNVLNFATRGPHLNTELIASLLCLLALTWLL
ncbi:uncharacterized protein LOC132983732 isoform X2 [Labrus mixtus]|uniref:uncharacterized protein LOC132983732 isoform X2 n=1 Tax=Labrus mixtus TaxID=508554 RepID=UPI0029C003E2|nr:uncharacterized protein LOC132983732 isoform X2 [Labrus mixtus]